MIRNIAWLAIERGGIIACGLLSSALIARAVGVEGYGSFQYGLAAFNIFLAFTYFCGAEVIVPKLSANPQDERKICVNTFVLRFWLAFVTFFSFICYVLLFGPEEKLYIVIFGLMLFLKEPFGVIIALFQSRTDNKKTALIQLLGTIVKTVLVVVLFYMGVAALEVYALAWLLESLAVALALTYLGYKVLGKINISNVSSEYMLKLLKAGAPIGLAFFLLSAMQRIDRLILPGLIDAGDFGAHAAAMQITENLYLLGNIVIISLAPLLIYSVGSIEDVRRNMITVVAVMVALGLGVVSLFYGFGEFIIRGLFGADYYAAALNIKYAVLVVFLYFVELSLSIFFYKYSLGRLVLIKYGLGLLVVLLGNFSLAPVYGAAGSILSLALGYIILIIFSLVVVCTFTESTNEASI
ncbi:oligosaccharide flippase family protein [Pseudomonas sp. gcc21]|uniref:oligosaccharide flippase family protein n=1 Tax=Pseudomonas sp. gcc21 TaxID=2726989 RepID=UPI0014511D8D|nr:oligosaccharide flippase family protein [Pseudomonas sp. gcc21]QJD58661.1 oligosaccharide flippase family protein [Pseudomonas sp. gcc21]